MKIRFVFLLAVIAILLEGCASKPQPPVSLLPESVNPHAGRIGVAMTALPKIDTQFPGAGCLLCYAFAAGANSSLTAHSHTLTYEDIPKLKDEVASRLRKNGADVIVIDGDLEISELSNYDSERQNTAKKDFSSFKDKYKIEKLLVINITGIGFIRTYSSYIPTSDPKSLLQGSGYLVNLSNNTYEWYQPVSIMKSADQTWDEPPNFPGLTNAYYQTLAIGKDSFLGPFTSNSLVATPPTVASETSAKSNPK